MTPSRCSETNGEDWQDPGVILGQEAENPQERRPNNDEEKDNKQNNLPSFSMFGAPEVSPISSVRRRHPVVLNDDSDEEPHDNFPAEKRGVKRWNVARSLTVVVWQSSPKEEAYRPHEDGYRNGDGRHNRGVRHRVRSRHTGSSLLGELRAPVPKCDNIDLLCALNNACTIDPCFDRSTTYCMLDQITYGKLRKPTFITEVQCKEDGTAGRRNGVHRRADVLNPSLAASS